MTDEQIVPFLILLFFDGIAISALLLTWITAEVKRWRKL